MHNGRLSAPSCLRLYAAHHTSPGSDLHATSVLSALTSACAELHRDSLTCAASAATCLQNSPLSVRDGQVAEVSHTPSWRSTILAKRSGMKSVDSRQPVVECSECT